MKVEVNVKPYVGDAKGLKGHVGVVFDGTYAFENIQIRSSKDGNLFVAYPNKAKPVTEDGVAVMENGKPQMEYTPILELTSYKARTELSGAILDAYKNAEQGKWTKHDYDLSGKFEITRIDVKPYVNEESHTTGVGSINFGDYKLNGVFVKDLGSGEFVDLPSYKNREEYRDVFHPITKEAQESLQNIVVNSLEGRRQEQQRAYEETQNNSQDIDTPNYGNGRS